MILIIILKKGPQIMIVCLCRGINDRQLRSEAIRSGGDVNKVMETTGAGTVCGSCCEAVHDMCSGSCMDCPSKSQLDQAPVQIGVAA